MPANHCLHVMAYYDHLAENIECDHPYAHYDWPEEARRKYDRVFNLSVVYGQLAHADFIRSSAAEPHCDDIERYEQTCA
jgi:hypothetical protein